METAVGIVVNSSESILNFTSQSVGFLLNNIFKSANEIQQIVKRTKANKDQCSRLNNRIQTLVGFLQGVTFSDTINESLKLALINFANFLQKCIEFMNKFTRSGFVKRVWNNKNYLDQFTNLQTEISQYTADLSLGLMLTGMTVNESQHRRDQQLDSIHMQQLLSLEHTEDIEDNSSSETSQQITIHEDSECEDQKENIFVSGVWKYQRRLDETWPDPSYFELVFDTKNETLRGFGEDHLGRFMLNGSFSECNQTIEMSLSYRDEKLNTDHQQYIQMQWDNDRSIFCSISMRNQTSTDQIDLSLEYFEMSLFTSLS